MTDNRDTATDRQRCIAHWRIVMDHLAEGRPDRADAHLANVQDVHGQRVHDTVLVMVAASTGVRWTGQ